MQRKPDAPKRKGGGAALYIVIIVTIISIIVIYNMMSTSKYKEKSYEYLVNNIEAVTEAKATPIGGENYGLYKLSFITKNNERYYVNLTLDQLESFQESSNDLNFEVKIVPKSENLFFTLLISLIPYVILIAIVVFFFNATSGGNNKAFDFAKSRAKESHSKNTTFNDVAGCDEEKEELAEVVDFLKSPKKYTKMGVRIPKGVLLVGPPGTGKTLLARAVAGEASVPFYTISGADFVEMFVGVGASRVRDLFKTARQNAPCIVFIDEIDAVGRQRGAGLGGGHDEREQTLNQLLVEMDGFSNHTGVIIMAATNRADVLDPALLRPGRFDRQIVVNLPDLKGRGEILKVHARNKHLDSTVKLDEIAPRIPGFSGADIENLLNEAGLLAARANRDTILTSDIDEAIDRVIMGPAKKSRKYDEDEKKLVAYHEAGHAVVGIKFENANIVQKVTIIPRGYAGGYNLMMPEKEKFLQTKESLIGEITGLLAGRCSEELVLNVNSTGAYDDFKRATKIARSMVTEYGMSRLGPVQYETRSSDVFLGRDYLKEKNFSDQIALEIDKEVREIIEECYSNAKKCLTDNKDLLDLIANNLIKYETLTKENIEELVKTGKLNIENPLSNNDEEIKNENDNNGEVIN